VSKFGAIVQKRKQEKQQGVNPEADYVAQAEGKGGATDTGKRLGRPPGKRSNPDFEQVTAYLRKDTYQAVRVTLLQSGSKKQFSDVVQELLEVWLTKNSKV
jgi:hypothetical protein